MLFLYENRMQGHPLSRPVSTEPEEEIESTGMFNKDTEADRLFAICESYMQCLKNSDTSKRSGLKIELAYADTTTKGELEEKIAATNTYDVDTIADCLLATPSDISSMESCDDYELMTPEETSRLMKMFNEDVSY
jgi:hypothetical protein